MQWEGVYVIDSPSAEALRAIYSVWRDLTNALDCIEEYLERDFDLDDSQIGPALWSSALMHYKRARQGHRGNKVHRPVWLGLTAEQSHLDAELCVWRDRLYSHAVGIGEDLAVRAFVNPGPGGVGYAVYGVSVAMTHVTTPGRDHAKRFYELLKQLIPKAKAIESVEHRRVWSEVAVMPIEQILKGRPYVKEIHFDESSQRYRAALRKAKRDNADGNDGR